MFVIRSPQVSVDSRQNREARQMTVLGDLLFYRRDQVDLDHVLHHQVELLRQKVDALPDAFFAQKTDDEIAAHVAKEATVEPLQVDFANAVAEVREVQVERRDDYGFDRGRSARVPGLQATIQRG